MIKAGLIGAGKMGLSHFAILSAHPDVEMAAICDNAGYLTSTLSKYTNVNTYSDFKKMFDKESLDCVFVATPTKTHFTIAEYALNRDIAVFSEKPLSLSMKESKKLSDMASEKGLATQVGYHNRFIGTFIETQRLIRSGAIGDIYHVHGSAFGQVVVKAKKGNTWRAKKSEGGGCLQDYAAHVIDLMNFVYEPPSQVVSSQLQSIYSETVEDLVQANFEYDNGASGYIETNWSDESYRKMSTSIVVYGKKGKIVADRQECRVFLKPDESFEDYSDGWTIKYITDLQKPVNFYLRGEEYSSQIDSFVESVVSKGKIVSPNTFATAYETDRVIELIKDKSK